MDYYELNVVIKRENEEQLMAKLLDFGIEQMEVLDREMWMDVERVENSWDYVDPHLLDSLGDDITVKLYFLDDENQVLQMQKISDAITKDELGVCEISKLENEDWANEWKKYFKPFKISDTLVVSPSWEEYIIKNDEVLVEIDPGMAFGTGTHETTSMCGALIEKYLKKGASVLDVGCGSGILSIIAAKLGAKRVLAVDIDPLSIKVSRENIQLNEVENLVEVEQGDLVEKVEEKFDIVVANIMAEVIIDMAGYISNYLNDGGLFIASGIILDKEAVVVKTLEDYGFQVLETLRKGEWVALVASLGK